MTTFIDITKFVAGLKIEDKRTDAFLINPEQIATLQRYRVDELTKYRITLINDKEYILVVKGSKDNAEIRKLLGLSNDKETEKA